MLPRSPDSQPSTAATAMWLVKLRWAALTGQAAAVVAAQALFQVVLPIGWIAAVLVAEVAFNLAVTSWIKRHPGALGDGHLGTQLAGDLAAITALLYLCGGPANPFNFLYLVHVALASVVASARIAWGAVVVSSLAYGSLFVQSVPLQFEASEPRPVVTGADSAPHPDADGPHPPHGHHHAATPEANEAPPSASTGNDAHGGHAGHTDAEMALHLRGMWVAFVVAAVFIVNFITRVQRTLSAQRLALEASRLRAERAERLASLGTLAAGAAHELATPLASIGIAASELAHEVDGHAREDVLMIQGQVERCRSVLQRMSAELGLTAGEGRRETDFATIVDMATDGLRLPEQLIVTGEDVRFATRMGPLASALRPLIDNAVAAGDGDGRVEIHAQRTDDSLVITVRDDGPGMPADVLERVGEPFFTTKALGEGVGLGVYVARSIAEQLGGTLHLRSVDGDGVRATLTLPLA